MDRYLFVLEIVLDYKLARWPNS